MIPPLCLEAESRFPQGVIGADTLIERLKEIP